MSSGIDTIRKRFEKLDTIRAYYLEYPDGVRDEELADAFGLTRRMAYNYRVALDCQRVNENKYPARYAWQPSERVRRFATMVLK